MTPSADIQALDNDATGLQALVAELRAQVAVLIAQNAALLARVTELERQVGLNSGKPPSSDGLKKPARVSSMRETSGKPPGEQKGHPGKTLCRTETPDATVDHVTPAYDGCGAALREAMATGHAARQVFDLPEPQPLVVTEHRAHRCHCTACGRQTRAAFPAGVTAPVQYGARVTAFVVYLLHDQLLPEKRLAELMADLFGVNLVTATVAAMSQTCAARFEGFAATVRGHVAAAAVKHLDEDGQPALVRPAGTKRCGRQPRRVGHLLLRLSSRKQDVLRFLSDPAVPFTSNLAECDGRMMKLRQKISGGLRSMGVAAELGIIRSPLSTAKKQGWDVLSTLAAQPSQLLTQLRTG
ncbi:MAG: IS66 family transposase [Janthinobacterium lividum]